MNMWEAFLATFLGTILGGLVVGVSFLATWKFMANWVSQVGRSALFQLRMLCLTVRFASLVIRGRRKYSEHASWYRSETFRIHLFNLVSQAPRAQMEMFRSAMQPLRKLSFAHRKMLLGSPLGILTEVLGGISLGELGTPSKPQFDDISRSERAEWFISQPYAEIAEWALRLGRDDRIAWMSWLKSQESQTEIEKAMDHDELSR